MGLPVLSRIESILHSLREKGYRITKIRAAMLDILSLSKSPLSALEIQKKLSTKKITANKTTIYREIDFLLGLHLVHEIDILDGKKRYELVVEGHHHHHLVCTKCTSITCVDVCAELGGIENMIQKSHDFKVTGHVFEFFGLCKECQEA